MQVLTGPTNPEEVDVAIVGGGVGGCYAGYRLASEGTLRVTALYEASGRIGGRLWSARLPGLPNVPAELGGMRFHEEIHIVSDLIRHLGLEAADFSFGEPENLAYVRGVRLRQSQLTDPGLLPYRLLPHEQGLGRDGLTRLAIENALPGFARLWQTYHTAFRQERWDEAEAAASEYEKRKEDIPLRQWSWETLLRQALSPEAIDFLEDTGGYEGLASNGNAANWLDGIFYTPGDVRHQRLLGGFDALPRVLHERFDAAGGRTRLHHRLRRFDRAAGGGYDLLFEGEVPRVRARTVVLALPQRALELLDQDNFLFQDEELRRNLASVQSVGAVKLFLAYPFPWWEAAGVARGRSTTDLPLRQLWYWGAEEQTGSALLLALYTNGEEAESWRRLQGGDPRVPSRRLVERAHAMLLEVHGVEQAPAPSAALWQDWSADPFGGAWHVWREGRDARRIIPAVRRPLPGEEVFIVSDCWSHEPGSVQGSLCMAECVLQDDLGLPWPDWLRRVGTRLGPRRPG